MRLTSVLRTRWMRLSWTVTSSACCTTSPIQSPSSIAHGCTRSVTGWDIAQTLVLLSRASSIITFCNWYLTGRVRVTAWMTGRYVTLRLFLAIPDGLSDARSHRRLQGGAPRRSPGLRTPAGRLLPKVRSLSASDSVLSGSHQPRRLHQAGDDGGLSVSFSDVAARSARFISARSQLYDFTIGPNLLLSVETFGCWQIYWCWVDIIIIVWILPWADWWRFIKFVLLSIEAGFDSNLILATVDKLLGFWQKSN